MCSGERVAAVAVSECGGGEGVQEAESQQCLPGSKRAGGARGEGRHSGGELCYFEPSRAAS